MIRMFMSRKWVSLCWYGCILFCICFSLGSCINTKEVAYFNNLPDSDVRSLRQLQPPPAIIQINDILEIKVGGENEKTVQYINQYFSGTNNSNSATGGALQVIVDLNGNIELPKIGKLKLAGLTRDAARDTITNAYKEYLLEPIVAVKFGNFRFSVLGEVKAPGNFSIVSEKVNIFEALAQAGDLTQFAERNKIKIIRDINGKREILSLNLIDSSILNSPEYYINRYDVIYAEPKNVKVVTENFQRTATYIATVASVLALVLLLFRN